MDEITARQKIDAVQYITKGGMDDKFLAILVNRLGGQVNIPVQEVQTLHGKEIVYHFHTDSVDLILFERGQAEPYLAELRKESEVLTSEQVIQKIAENVDGKRD